MAGYIGNAPINNSIFKQVFTPSTGDTTFTPGTAYTPGFIDVYQNGVKLIDTTDYTASNGTTVVLGVAATTGDTVEIVIYETFQSAAPSAYTGNFSVSGTGTVSGAFRHGVLAKSADYTVLSTDPNVCLVTTAGTNRTMTLPAASAVAGQIIRFIKVDTGTGKLIIARAGSDTMGINANLTMELWFQDNYVDLMSDGSSRWIVVGTEMFTIPEASRTSGGNPATADATNDTWIDANYSTGDQIVPAGTSHIEIQSNLKWVGSGTADYVSIYVRPKGSTTGNVNQNAVMTIGLENLASNHYLTTREMFIIQCDINRTFQWYAHDYGDVTIMLWMWAYGYRLG